MVYYFSSRLLSTSQLLHLTNVRRSLRRTRQRSISSLPNLFFFCSDEHVYFLRVSLFFSHFQRKYAAQEIPTLNERKKRKIKAASQSAESDALIL